MLSCGIFYHGATPAVANIYILIYVDISSTQVGGSKCIDGGKELFERYGKLR
jgi:hypothetical protein